MCEAYVIPFLFGSFFTVCHPYIDVHFVKCFLCDFRDGMGKKWPPHVLCTKHYIQNSALDVVISLYEPYQSFSSVFISNKTISIARDHRWSAKLACR